MNCLPQKPLTSSSQIILTRPAQAEVAVNRIKLCKRAEYGISNRGVLTCKKLIPVWIRAHLIIRNNIIRCDGGECEQQ